MKGITFNQVKECLQQLNDSIPATDEVCSEYTLNVSPAWTQQREKGKDYEEHPDLFVMNVKVGKIKINLRVEGFALVSESDEQLAKGGAQ